MGNLGLVNFSVWCALVVGALIDNKVQSDSSCDVQLSETLRTLLNPQDDDSLQVQALRRQLLRKLQEDLDLAELEDEKEYKRNLESIADLTNEYPNKRNLEALARAGTWYKNPPGLDKNDDANYKRSIPSALQNSQSEMQMSSEKRGIEALARNGDLHRRQAYQDYRSLLEALYDKRNVASLARSYNYPAGTTAGFGKRSLASLAKSGELPYAYGKRNIQSLARDGALGKRSADNDDTSLNKRNIQAIKAQQRSKRQADYFNNEAVYQMPESYEDILQDLAALQEVYPAEDKRFLGSVAKTGWFRPATRSYLGYTSMPDKRHVAALARLGWLPSYRSVRRFNRSGRSYLKSNDDENICRPQKEDPSNGKTKNYSYTKISSVPLDSKRYLLQPAVDNILLKKVFRHPRMTL